MLQGAYARDGVRAFYFDQPVADADLPSLRVLNADFECSADDRRAYYRQTLIADADPQTFPPGRGVTKCSDTSISFAE